MVKQMKWALAVLALTCAAAQQAEAISITIRPDMDLSATAGGTVGWGYDIVNDSVFWLSFDNINAMLDDPLEGNVDTSVFDLPIVNPGDTIFLDYDAFGALGLLALTLDGLLPAGTIVGGQASGSYGMYADADLTAFEGSVEWSVDFAATVADVAQVPEPSTWLLVGAGLVVIARRAARRPRLSDPPAP